MSQQDKMVVKLAERTRMVARIVLYALLLVVGSARTAAATFTATLDRDTVSMGDSVVLTLNFEGGQPKAIPALPNIPNLQVDDQGSSSQIVFNNGQISSTLTETLVLTPRQAGDYTIPSLQAEVGGQKLTTPPLTLKVAKAAPVTADKAGDQLAFMKLQLSKKEAYVGEVLNVELQVYIREGVVNAENILRDFDAFGGPPLKTEGFSTLKTAHSQRRRARVGSNTFLVATLVTTLSPLKTGPLSISSIDANLALQLPQQGQRRDPFGPFGIFPRFEERKVFLTAEPETINALPLPKDNVPADFNGAVGNFSLSVTAGPTNVASGDPVTVRVQISGRGAFDALSLPEQNAWSGFKIYPPSAKLETDPLGVQGTKTFEQVVVPQEPEVKELPPVKFSFFDPDQKTYRTLTQPAIPLAVRPAGSAAAPTIVSSARTQDNPAAQDIVHIKARFGELAHVGSPLMIQPWFLALQVLPVAGLISVTVWRRRSDQLANNPRLRRQRQVSELTRTGLGTLHQLAADKKSDDFFATLFRLMQEQLGERLDLPANSITESVIEDRLRTSGASAGLQDALRELFQSCNLARYAPVKSSQELAAMIPKFEAVVQDLQGLKL